MIITSVGLGTGLIGGPRSRRPWSGSDDTAMLATIRHAVDSGVNWIDTAPAYGRGHAEEIVARALAGRPAAERPYLFTKCALNWDDADPAAILHRKVHPAGLRHELEASLRRLRTDHVDLYQVHWPPLATGAAGSGAGGGTSAVADSAVPVPVEAYWEVLCALRAEGKIRALGMSNHGIPALMRAERLAHVDAVQIPFSLLNRSAAAQITWGKGHRSGVLAYSPLGSGLLAGGYLRAHPPRMPVGDWRAEDPQFTIHRARNLAVTDALRPVAHRHCVPVAAVAAAWVLAWPGVTGAIVGARRPDQVDGWLPAATLTLTSVDLQEIQSAVMRTGVGCGPTHPEQADRSAPRTDDDP